MAIIIQPQSVGSASVFKRDNIQPDPCVISAHEKIQQLKQQELARAYIALDKILHRSMVAIPHGLRVDLVLEMGRTFQAGVDAGMEAVYSLGIRTIRGELG